MELLFWQKHYFFGLLCAFLLRAIYQLLGTMYPALTYYNIVKRRAFSSLVFDAFLKMKLWLLLDIFNQPKHIFVNNVLNNVIQFWFMNGQSAISYNANNIWGNIKRENIVTWNVEWAYAPTKTDEHHLRCKSWLLHRYIYIDKLRYNNLYAYA